MFDIEAGEMNVAVGDKIFSDKHFLSPTSENGHQNHSSRQGRDSGQVIMIIYDWIWFAYQ